MFIYSKIFYVSDAFFCPSTKWLLHSDSQRVPQYKSISYLSDKRAGDRLVFATLICSNNKGFNASSLPRCSSHTFPASLHRWEICVYTKHEVQ